MEYSPDCKVNKEKKMSKEDGKRGKEKKFGEMMRERILVLPSHNIRERKNINMEKEHAICDHNEKQ